MRNLRHVSIEKLELLPERQKPWHYLTTKYEIIAEKDNRDYDIDAFNQLYQRVKKIIKFSVGKNWNDVYSHIKSIVRHVPFDFQVDDFVHHHIHIPCWSYRNQRWEFKENYRWGRNKDLLEHIEFLKKRISNYAEWFYYVCPRSNMIRLVKSRVWEKEKDASFWRRHYKFQTERKRKYKERRTEKESNALLSMINHPELYKFYSSIKRSYKLMAERLQEGEKFWCRHRKSTGIDKFWARYKKPTKAKIFELESLKRQIEDLEAGNFNTFFESAVYLYSQQKECHHFAQP